VVAADANYVKPYITDIIVIAPGETVDALVVADAPPGRYYMVAMSTPSPARNTENPSRGILHYKDSSSEKNSAVAPEMPCCYDKGIRSFYFHGNLTSLPHPLLTSVVPVSVDERLLVTTDMGYICKEGGSACGDVVARMNNISFQLPTTTSLLEAHYDNNMSNTISMLLEFPSIPPPNIVFNKGTTVKATSFMRVRYNTTLEIVFQGPPEDPSFPNPMHLHGHDFFVLAQGLGTFNAEKDVKTYNLVDPPVRNMALVPRFGWTAIRFVTNNPGTYVQLYMYISP
jgi:laccase